MPRGIWSYPFGPMPSLRISVMLRPRAAPCYCNTCQVRPVLALVHVPPLRLPGPPIPFRSVFSKYTSSEVT